MTSTDDYSWDLYKLLVVPSRTRLFFARVSGHGGDRAEDRVENLAYAFVRLIERYAPARMRQDDELGAVIVPAAKRAVLATRLLWLEGGRMRSETVASGPDDWRSR